MRTTRLLVKNRVLIVSLLHVKEATYLRKTIILLSKAAKISRRLEADSFDSRVGIAIWVSNSMALFRSLQHMNEFKAPIAK